MSETKTGGEAAKPLPRLERTDWGELHFIQLGHHGEIFVASDEDFHACLRCHQDPRVEPECHWDVTFHLETLWHNLVIVIALAAAAQQAREQASATWT